MESISTYLKGRVTISELMDRPFRELHELYRLLFLKAEANEAAKKAEEEAAKKAESEGKTTDAKSQQPNIDISSPLMAEALEDALEEMM